MREGDHSEDYRRGRALGRDGYVHAAQVGRRRYPRAEADAAARNIAPTSPRWWSRPLTPAETAHVQGIADGLTDYAHGRVI